MATKVITLHLDTRTLRFPDLKDLHDVVEAKREVQGVASVAPGGSEAQQAARTKVDMGNIKFAGKVDGLTLLRLKKAPQVDKVWVIEGRTLELEDGTLNLGDYSLLITGASTSVTLTNVVITGKGRRGPRHTDPYLLRVTNGARVSIDQGIVECESPQPHALLVDGGAKCNITGTRVYSGGVGAAIKVSGGTVLVSKRCLLQGGVTVTAPQPASTAGSKLDAAAAAATQPLPGAQPDPYETALAAALHQPPVAADPPSALPREAEAPSSSSADKDAPVAAAAAPGSRQRRGGHAAGGGGKPAEPAPPPHQPEPAAAVAVASRLEVRNSEVLAGPVACLTAHGSGSRVLLEACHVGAGGTNHGVLASHGAHVELAGCEVNGAANIGVSLSGGAKLQASSSVVSAGVIGLRVLLGASAHVAECKFVSTGTPSGAPLVAPPPPKPGFIADFMPAIPAPVEARGRGAAVVARDCVFGAPGVAGWRAVAGGQVAAEEGLADALRPLSQLNYERP